MFAAANLSAADRAERERDFPTHIQPLLKKYCFTCHNEKDPQGSLTLTKFKSPQQILEGRKTWITVLDRLQKNEMPPEESKVQPTKGERETLATWIAETINDLNCNGSPEPGRVTIRRLNRREYQNTVRDLTGVDYHPARDFPGDDVGYGFDNIADVISLPTILMEKYLTAADEIATKAIVTEPPKKPLDKRIVATSMTPENTKADKLSAFSRLLLTEGELWDSVPIPEAGDYEFRIMAAGDQAGNEPVKMSLKIDGKEVHAFEVKNGRDKPKEYVATVAVKAKTRRVAVAFTNDFWDEKGKEKERDRNLLVTYVHITGPANFKPPEMPEGHRKLIFVTPEGRVTRKDAAEKVLQRLASRAFRRPATDAEVAKLVALTERARENGDSFEQSIQMALQALLVSPQFLYKLELDPPGKEKQARPLNDYEIGTRLSYFLWSSMPDDELFRLELQGKLKSPEELSKQVRRMLADEKSRALVQNFFGQWLELRSLDIRTPDRTLFTTFNERLRQAMRTETGMFVESIIKEDRSILDLLDADYTFVNQRLAEHYNIKNVTGEEFKRVSLAGTDRGGILTQASILTITSNPTRTSPVKRGKWILENILGTPPPPAPANVPELESQKQLTGTLRERMEQHRVNPTCAVCHKQMDALGFAFENFDGVGRWRTADGEGKVNAAGILPSP